MHDLSALELNEGDEFELAEDLEWQGEDEENEDEDEQPELEEPEELEAAAQLLSVGSEAELDGFLGDLIKKASAIVGRSVKAATGNSLGKLLKGVARHALPMVATAIGGPGGGLATKAALSAFGLEAAVRWAMRRHAPSLYRHYRHHRWPHARLGWHRPWISGAPAYPGYPSAPAAAGYDDGRAAAPLPYPPPPALAPHVCANCSAALPAPQAPPPAPAAPLPAAPEAAPDDQAAPSELEEEESEYGAPLHAIPGQAGRWVRRGRVIVLFGV